MLNSRHELEVGSFQVSAGVVVACGCCCKGVGSTALSHYSGGYPGVCSDGEWAPGASSATLPR